MEDQNFASTYIIPQFQHEFQHEMKHFSNSIQPINRILQFFTLLSPLASTAGDQPQLTET